MKVDIDFRQCEFRFSAKPPAEVLTALRNQGFRWQPVTKVWRRRNWNGLPDGFANWIIAHAKGAAVEHDHSGIEDRACGDAAYEDACARACGL